MKKLIVTILLLLPTILLKAQQTPPAGLISVKNDLYVSPLGELWVYKGAVYGWNRIPRFTDITPSGGDTFSNGITKSGGIVRLGGALTQTTSIGTAGNIFSVGNYATGSNGESLIGLNLTGAGTFGFLGIIGNHIQQIAGGNGYMSMSRSNPSTSSEQAIRFLDANMQLEDTKNRRGLVALGNYHANYTAFTYTDKSYVDSVVAASGGGGVPTGRTIATGYGLLGGGDLSANRTLVTDTSVIGTKSYNNRYELSSNKTANFTSPSDTKYPTVKLLNDSTTHRNNNLNDVTDKPTALANIGGVPTGRQLLNGYGITGGGTLLTDRTIAVDTTAIRTAQNSNTKAQDDARFGRLGFTNTWTATNTFNNGSSFPLVLDRTGANSIGLQISRSTVARWQMYMDASDDFLLRALNSSGTLLGNVIKFANSTQVARFYQPFAVTGVTTGTAGTDSLAVWNNGGIRKIAPTSYALASATGSFIRLTGSGTGALTTITIPHGLSGVSASSIATIQPINAASAGVAYITTDATNVNIVYTVAPASGTNNLSYNLIIKP